MDDKHELALRRKAVRLTWRGLSPQAILKQTPRSRSWLFKWQQRFTEGGWAGLKSQSRRPQHSPHQYDRQVQGLVLRVRRQLQRRKVGLVGAPAIRRELRHARLLRKMPATATIDRWLKAAGLSKAAPSPPPPVYYPQPQATERYVLHACDGTARYLEGGQKVFAFHTIDVQTRAIKQTISTDKTTATVRRHALETWQTLGLPDALQLDNDAAFCGGYKVPRLVGQFVRLCLYLGIELIFIPVGEPKRNGLVERLNGLWSQSYWRRRRFRSLAHVTGSSPEFEDWYASEYEPPP